MSGIGLLSYYDFDGLRGLAAGRRRPLLMTEGDYRSLGEVEKSGYNVERYPWNACLPHIRHPDTQLLARHLGSHLAENVHRPPGHKVHLALEAPYGYGKTHMAMAIAIEIHRREIARRGAEIEVNGINAVHVPVAFTTARSVRNTRSFFDAQLSFYEPFRPGNADVLLDRLFYFVRKSGTQLIIVDDAHAISTLNPSSRRLADDVKSYLNHLPATLLVIGSPLAGSVFKPASSDLRDPAQQIGNRFKYITMQGFTRDDAEWVPFIRALERSLVLVAQRPGMLSSPSATKWLFKQTQGVTGRLVHWIESAAVAAIGNQEFVDPDVLMATPLIGADVGPLVV